MTPRLAPARFAEYLVDLPAGCGCDARVEPGLESFFYVLDGAVILTTGSDDVTLSAGRYAYVPVDTAAGFRTTTSAAARLLWLKRRYQAWPGLAAPAALSGHRDDEPFAATATPGLARRELLPPGDPAFDFNMSLMRFEAGAGLGMTEIHDEEHGLYMLAGGGTYTLDGADHAVRGGDFIYMAPYCPQGFAAADGEPAEYLLYKDVWRDGF